MAVDPPRRVVIAPTSGGEIVVAAAQSGVQAWDALTGVVRWTAVPADGRPYALAAGVLDGQHLIAVGTSAGTVCLFDAENGARLGHAPGGGEIVRALAIADDQFGSMRLVAGRGNGRVEQWFLEVGSGHLQISLAPAVIDVGAVEVNAVAAACYHGTFVIAVGSAGGIARIWDGDTGEPAGPECTHSGEVRGVALTESSGALRMATGSFDQQAVVWNPYAGYPSTEPMPHPASVLDIAFGVVDGRLMLATACSDSNARLWDPIKPSGARLAVSGRVTRTALKDTPHEGLVAGTSEDGKVFVWRADDGELLHTLEPPGSRNRANIALPSPRAVTLGRLDDRTIVAATTSRTARAWRSSGDPIADLTWDANPHDRAAVAIIDSAILIADCRGGSR